MAGTSPNSNHGQYEKIALAAQETLSSGPWIGTTLIRAADRTVDQLQISDRSMLFKDLRVPRNRSCVVVADPGRQSQPGERLAI
jgi:hypothetical protein